MRAVCNDIPILAFYKHHGIFHDAFVVMMFFLLLACLPFLHEYHSSITELRYKSKKQTIEVITSVFIDDFEKAVRKHAGNSKLTLDETKKYEAEVSAYILAHLKLQNAKQQAIQGTYIGKKMKEETFEIYIEFPAKNYSDKWRVLNDAITEIYADQINIINCFHNDESVGRKTMMFRRGASWDSLP